MNKEKLNLIIKDICEVKKIDFKDVEFLLNSFLEINSLNKVQTILLITDIFTFLINVKRVKNNIILIEDKQAAEKIVEVYGL